MTTLVDRTPAPCKNCDDRFEGCHAVCKYYISWSKERHERKAMMEQRRKEIEHADHMKYLKAEKTKRMKKSHRDK